MRVVFLDVDAVLADPFTPAYKAHGYDYTYWDVDSYEFSKKVGKTQEEFWDTHPVTSSEEFWATLPKLPWADDLVKLCQAKSTTVAFLTHATKSPACLAGKMRWLRDHWPKIPYFICNKKVLVAGHGKTLIDDYVDNIAGWIGGGGDGILFPAPFNSLKGLDPLLHVESRLRGSR